MTQHRSVAGGQGGSTRDVELVALVESYFASVDRMDLDATLACFTEDARVTIATFDTLYAGRDDAIRGMNERLFARYKSVWHGDFDHIVQGPARIASRFTVRNVMADANATIKHNCNFFSVRETRFDEVFIFMSGDNSLR